MATKHVGGGRVAQVSDTDLGRFDGRQPLDIEEGGTEMNTIYVCAVCGSPRVFADAYAALNSAEVRTFDYTHCDDCDGECRTMQVEVLDDFDIESDFYAQDGEA